VPLRIVFCGTPAFALPTFHHLLAQSDFKIDGVVTQPDRPRGRGNSLASSAVKEAAIAAGIPVYQPQKIRAEEGLEYFRRMAPDVVVIIAYGQIIPQRLIEIPRLGWINLHGSLLPKYRGAAPIHWAVANGETRTGLTTMQIDAGLDTGPTLLKYETRIGPDETSPDLYARLAEAGAPLMTETLRVLENGSLTPTPQDNSLATLAPPLKKEDGRIDWSFAAQKIYNRMRGFKPWPGTFSSFRGKICQLWGQPADTRGIFLGDRNAANDKVPGLLSEKGNKLFAACGAATALEIESIRIEGKKRMAIRDFLNGAHLKPGERFGE
jgi:methionyl-tRNA formyltransferase